jgi:hypothetical protein
VPQTIALLTDFGMRDAYVGMMKAVMLRIAPDAHFVDITHSIQPQNVRQGAFTLLTCYRYFAPGTIFLVVVDPGVGSIRKPLAALAGDYYFIGPDNGVLSYAVAEHLDAQIVELSNPAYWLSAVSGTFHGRDIFAPTAAHLAAGVPLAELGQPFENFYRILPPYLEVAGSVITGEILHIDRFGNAVTSIGELRRAATDGLYLIPPFTEGERRYPVQTFAPAVTIQVKGFSLAGIRHTYSEVAPGEPLALIGSSGYLEIAVNQGSAASRLNLTTGDSVILEMG